MHKTHLHTVKDLLSHLDQMRKDGRGAQDRLKYLLQQGAQLFPNFDLQETFSEETRSMNAKLERLEELAAALTKVKELWATNFIESEEHQAGLELMRHLEFFVEDRRRAERSIEIEMLTQLWGTAPDLREKYPWLTAWTGPIKYQEKLEDRLKQANQLLEKQGVIIKSLIAKLEHPTEDFDVPSATSELEELEAKKLELQSEIEKDLAALEVTLAHESELELPAAFGVTLKKATKAPPLYLVKQDGSVRVPPLAPPLVNVDFSIKAWTAALNEKTGMLWTIGKIDSESHWIIMRWSRDGQPDSQDDVILRVQSCHDGVFITLRVLCEGQIERTSRLIPPAGLEDLQAHPTSFIQSLRKG